MGTRSLTIIFDGGNEICRIYGQMDGYPTGMGADLALLCNVKLVNGYQGNGVGQANGMGCLAAQIIAGLKEGCGGIYLEPTGGEINDECDYIYTIRGEVGQFPTIEATSGGKEVFPPTPANELTFESLSKFEAA